MILVTGAGGLSGFAVAKEFSARHIPVRALVRDPARAAHVAKLANVETVAGDMAQANSLSAALDGIERVLMISTANHEMVEAQCRFVDACKAAGVSFVAKLSGRESGVGFQSKNFRFTHMHEEIETYLERSGLGWSHLRPSQFMQVYLREAQGIATEGLLRLPFGEIKLAPVDIADVANIAVALLMQSTVENRGYNITGPEALSMVDIAAAIGRAIERPVRYQNNSTAERRHELEARGASPFMLDALDEQAEERLRHPLSEVELGTHRIFGVKPTRFADFARRHAEVFRSSRGPIGA